MKKKLLTILLSVFMVMATFATNVFASGYTFISDILATVEGGFPTSQSNAWKCSSSICVAYKLGNNLYIVQSLAPSISIDVNSNVSKISDSQYKYHNSTDNYDVLFNLFENKLISVELTGVSGDNSLLNGTYAKTLTIADILSNNFPSTDLSGWGGASTNTVIYRPMPDMDSLYIKQTDVTGPYIISQNQTISYVTNNQYKYHNTEAGKEFDIFFNLDSGSLQSITISEATGDLVGINDTYTAPLLVSDIIPSNFPNAEASAWTNGTHKIYLVSDEIKLDGTINVLDLDGAVRPDGNGNYHFTDSLGKLTFIMDGDKFTSIVASGFSSPYETANGTYSAPLTVADILEKSETDFPTTPNLGWINDNGKRSYVNSGILTVSYNVPLESILQKDGNNYKYVSGSQVCTFVMISDVLTCINVSGAIFTDFNGDYYPYKYEIEPTESKPQGYTGNLIFKTNAQYTNDSDVVVKVEGTPLVLNTDYTLEHGSIKVTLLGSYIKNLVPKTYTISIGVPGSYEEISSQFTITGSSPSPTPNPNPSPTYSVPNTSVEAIGTNNHLLLKLSSLSLLSIGAYMAIKKKDK